MRTVSPCVVWTAATGPSGPQATLKTSSTHAATAVCMARDRGLRGGFMVSAIAFTLCIFIALGVFFRQLWGRFNLLRAAKPAKLFDRIPERIEAVFVYAFGQQKFV